MRTILQTGNPIAMRSFQAVPQAMFDGPSVFASDKNHSPEKLAKAMVSGRHMVMINDHYYVMGNGTAAEKNLAENHAHFLSNNSNNRFEKSYAVVGSKLMVKGVSDTYTASLWTRYASHWWTVHHILGLNYHTVEWVGPDGSFRAQNYSAFLHQPRGKGLKIRPPSYGYWAFTQGALGWLLDVAVALSSAHEGTVYVYRVDDGFVYVTLINKTFAENAKPHSVSLQLLNGVRATVARRKDLAQKTTTIATQTEVTLGAASINAEDVWTGQGEAADTGSPQHEAIQVAPTSANIVHFLSSKLSPQIEIKL